MWGGKGGGGGREGGLHTLPRLARLKPKPVVDLEEALAPLLFFAKNLTFK